MNIPCLKKSSLKIFFTGLHTALRTGLWASTSMSSSKVDLIIHNFKTLQPLLSIRPRAINSCYIHTLKFEFLGAIGFSSPYEIWNSFINWYHDSPHWAQSITFIPYWSRSTSSHWNSTVKSSLQNETTQTCRQCRSGHWYLWRNREKKKTNFNEIANGKKNSFDSLHDLRETVLLLLILFCHVFWCFLWEKKRK